MAASGLVAVEVRLLLPVVAGTMLQLRVPTWLLLVADAMRVLHLLLLAEIACQPTKTADDTILLRVEAEAVQHTVHHQEVLVRLRLLHRTVHLHEEVPVADSQVEAVAGEVSPVVEVVVAVADVAAVK